MPRNIEIKARVEALQPVERRAASLASSGPFELEQDDTFFRCPSGRLKLRTTPANEGQLIFYRREEHTGPKESFFVLSPTSSPDSLREALTLAYGCVGRVRKLRTLYLVGRTRVHLDRVEELGEYLELEVVLEEGESIEAATAEALDLLARLGIALEQLVAGAYIDLLAARVRPPAK